MILRLLTLLVPYSCYNVSFFIPSFPLQPKCDPDLWSWPLPGFWSRGFFAFVGSFLNVVAFARASSAVIFPSATASFNFSVNIEVIVEIRSQQFDAVDSATSLSVAPSIFLLHRFSIPSFYSPAPGDVDWLLF